MIFNKHSELRGQHAILSPSQSSWLRYSDDKIIDKVISPYRTQLGSEIHEFAASQIELNHKISSIKNLVDSLENYIYTKYLYLSDNHYEVSAYGKALISNIRYLPKAVFETVKYYINDGVGYKMTPELMLVYSEYCFGTADTLAFRNRLLRIHDLKTGDYPAHMEQLEVYAALFCLEYRVNPVEIDMELRLYQSDDILVHNPTVEDILPIMDKIVTSNKVIDSFWKEEQA